VKTLLTKIHVSLPKMKCRKNIRKNLDGLLNTNTITSRLSSEKVAPRFTFSNKVSYLSCTISLILHTFAKCFLTLPILTSLRSRKVYRICIQLVTAIVLHLHKTLQRPLADLWLSIYVKFVPYMNRAFSLDTIPATSSRGTRNRVRTNK